MDRNGILAAILDEASHHGSFVTSLREAGKYYISSITRADLDNLRRIESVFPDAYRFALMANNYVPSAYSHKVIGAMLAGFGFDEVRAAMAEKDVLRDEKANYRSPTEA